MLRRGIDRVLDAAADLHMKACSKQSTQQLNAWLEDWRRAHPPTPGRGTRLK
jgi:predicted GTPase